MNRRHAFGLFIAGTAWPAFALDDPQPDPVLALVLGEWHGSLSRRDGQQAGAEVTLPARLYVSMNAPDEMALHFAYGASPGRLAYGYERLRFEFASDTLVWISGAVEKTAWVGRIVSSTRENGLRRCVVDTTKDRTLSRYTFDFGAREFNLQKDDVDAGGKATRQSRHVFRRA